MKVTCGRSGINKTSIPTGATSATETHQITTVNDDPSLVFV